MIWFQCFRFVNCLSGVRTNTSIHYCFGDSLAFSLLFLYFWQRENTKAWNSPGFEWMASMRMWNQYSGFFPRLPLRVVFLALAFASQALRKGAEETSPSHPTVVSAHESSGWALWARPSWVLAITLKHASKHQVGLIISFV